MTRVHIDAVTQEGRRADAPKGRRFTRRVWINKKELDAMTANRNETLAQSNGQRFTEKVWLKKEDVDAMLERARERAKDQRRTGENL